MIYIIKTCLESLEVVPASGFGERAPGLVVYTRAIVHTNIVIILTVMVQGIHYKQNSYLMIYGEPCEDDQGNKKRPNKYNRFLMQVLVDVLKVFLE